MLNLPVSGDLALQLHQVFGAAIDRAKRGQANRTDDDQQSRDGQKRDQQLGVYRERRARDGVR